MLSFYLDHQMDFFPISFDHFRKRRDQGAAGFKFCQRHLSHAKIKAEDPAKIGVMNGNRVQIFGPAQIELNSSNPLIQRPIKGIHRIFKYVPIIIISPVRDNFTALQAISVGNSLRPTGIESVQNLKKLDLQGIENFHF